MTAFEATTATTTATATAPAAQPQAVLTSATRRALWRDLARLDRVLREPVTAVRRSALIGHLDFLLNQLAADHRVQDQLIWPAAVAYRSDLADLAERVQRSHQAVVQPVTQLRTAAGGWATAADDRLAVRSTVQQLTVALGPVFELDTEVLPIACAAIPAGRWAELDRRIPRAGGPTRLARRLFWLLDELDPMHTELLLRHRRRAEMWILRNGFSGAYNRGSYLMWVGGGTGPAI